MNYKLLFTLDYEIHGNGDGNPQALMVEPTYRLMNLLEEYKQHLVIMADVAEILCFRRYREETGRDDFRVAEIEEQLRDAIRRGHDVQLHIHSSYFRAKWDGKHFDQCIEDYNMAALPYEQIKDMVSQCVCYLEDLLRPVRADYKVWLFRAANWSMMPTPALYRVLVEQGITHDTSVYKGGCQGGSVCYDYRTAYDNLLPYTASAENINDYDPMGAITELPIYTEMRPFYAFVSPIRLFRMLRAKFHRHKQPVVAATASSEATAIPAQRENGSSVAGVKKEHIPSAEGVEKEGVSSVEGMKKEHIPSAEGVEKEGVSSVVGVKKEYIPSAEGVERESVSSVAGMKKEYIPSAEGVEKEGVSSVVGHTERQRIEQSDNRRITLRSFFTLSPLKMDFNQLRSRQLIRMLQHIESRLIAIEKQPAGSSTSSNYAGAAGSTDSNLAGVVSSTSSNYASAVSGKDSNRAGVVSSTSSNYAGAVSGRCTEPIPVVLIGHSKTFIPYNETTLRPFLRWIEKHPASLPEACRPIYPA